MGKTLILIDGHALAFRQYYALERTNMRTSDGVPSWAVYGFFKAIFDLLKNEDLKADAIAVAFDVSHKTFRTEAYSEYKSNREAMPDPMRQQMEIIYEGLKAFDIPIYTKEGFEADDVIGTISKKACELGHKVLILTGDQDAFQLVDKDGCVKVILPSKGELIEYNWNKIYEKLLVYPDQVIDYKALRGDTSDCIPGVKGIGEKTAQKLLARYGSLEALLEDCENIPEKSVKEKICSGIEQAKMSKYLATIIRDLDINFDFDKTNIQLPELSKVTDFLKRMQFFTFLKNINEILKTFCKSDNGISHSNIPVTSGPTQLGFFTEVVTEELNKTSVLNSDTVVVRTLEDLSVFKNTIKNFSLCSFLVFADVKNVLETDINGIVFSVNSDFVFNGSPNISDTGSVFKTFYLPVKHSAYTSQLDLQIIKNVLNEIFADENIKKVTYDVKNSTNILRNFGVELRGVIFDNLLASYVKDPQRNHELDALAIEKLDYSIVPFAEYDKKNPVKFCDANFDNAVKYAQDSSIVNLELLRVWQKDLTPEELKLVSDVEVPFAKVLADMEFVGVAIDKEYLQSLTVSMNNELLLLEQGIFNLADCQFNINSPRQVGQVLFEKMGLKAKKKRGKANYSTNAAVLEELAEDYEIARLILDYRRYAKLKSTYTEALPELINPVDGRIHTTYNQTTTATGRLSSSNPNLQNIPVRTEEGNKIRNSFVPGDRERACILSADYSQIELRLLAHISKDINLIDAFNSNTDVHTLTASKVFNVPIEEVTKEMRYKAKAVNFGIIYGQSKYGLAKSLDITPAEAEEFINKYFLTYPNVKIYMEATSDFVEQNGYIETIFGRKRYLETELNSSNAMIREFAKRAAINHPMQGTAADLIKMAMINFNQKLKENNLNSRMIIQVHDEIVVEAYKDELDKVRDLLVKSMELDQPLSVPLVVDVNAGESWKEL